ncbi:MAG: hypothetical protein HKM24_03455 [Gammaproteobacteria bacterium]|nr:hypothetical protein [Gammaproteobacteria bacterium]
MTDDVFLAIDQGGHASRALLFTADGELVAKHRVKIATDRPGDDRVEQDPEEIISSVKDAVSKVIKDKASKGANIKAAGLATQRSSIVCWDRETGKALSPVISWQDHRAADWLSEYGLFESEIRSITGLVMTPYYGASKIRWCLDHLDPVKEALKEQRLVCGPLASFVLYRCLEEKPLLVDTAHASRTLLCSIEKNNWSFELLEMFGIPESILPKVVSNKYDFGTIKTGRQRIPLTVCTGDQTARLFSNGSPEEDALYMNLGTGAFVMRASSDALPTDTEQLRSVVWFDGKTTQYAGEGTVNGCGSAIAEVAEDLGIKDDKAMQLADKGLASDDELPLFLNGVNGLASPFWRSDFTTQFVELDDNHTDEQKLGAVLESVAFLLAVNAEQLSSWGDEPKRIWLSGGITGNDDLCQRIVDLVGLNGRRPQKHEATARGLAYLVAKRPKKWATSIEIDEFEPKENDFLDSRYARWQRALFERMMV